MGRTAQQPVVRTPVRTCVGCRDRTAKSELLRVVLAPDGGQGHPVAVLDQRGRMAGRGAHLHPTRGCLDRAERRRAFARALRVPGPVDVSALRLYVDEQG